MPAEDTTWVDVTVMEKHADFLRDFCGDTVHASTLDELGLTERFADVPHREIDTLAMSVQGTEVAMDLRRIPGPHKHIALMPQWGFLELLASAAEKEPTFTLLRSTEVLGAYPPGDRVAGVRYRGADGEEREMHAALTVTCDGRDRELRAQSIEALHRGVGARRPAALGHRLDQAAGPHPGPAVAARGLIQSVQRLIHRFVIAVAVTSTGPAEAPRLVRIASKVPFLRAAAAYGVAAGPLPEHIPALPPADRGPRPNTQPTSGRRARRQSMITEWFCNRPGSRMGLRRPTTGSSPRPSSTRAPR